MLGKRKNPDNDAGVIAAKRKTPDNNAATEVVDKPVDNFDPDDWESEGGPLRIFYAEPKIKTANTDKLTHI